MVFYAFCSNWIVCDFVISQCLCLMSMPVTSGKQKIYVGKCRIKSINTLMTWTMKSWLAQVPGSWTNGLWNFIVPIYRSSNILQTEQVIYVGFDHCWNVCLKRNLPSVNVFNEENTDSVLQIHRALVGASKKRSAIVVIPNKIINTLSFLWKKRPNEIRYHHKNIQKNTIQKTTARLNKSRRPLFLLRPFRILLSAGSYQL